MRRLRPFLFLLTTALGLVAASAAEARNPLPKREREALVALYNATHGAQWKRNGGWLRPPGTECDWFGVQCGDETDPAASVAYVAILDLTDNRLRGTLPRRLNRLSGLYDLFLSRNQLAGPIPPDWSGMRNLRTLDLAANRLSGEIPRSLGSLSQLDYLSLDGNQLTGSPPAELANLKKLLFLGLGDNHLSGSLPKWVGELPVLSVLILCANDFTGPTPPEIFRSGSLTNLWLRECRLTGSIPREVSNSPHLTSIYLDGNQLIGAIPDTLLQLRDVSLIHLDWNALRTDDPELVAFLDRRTDSLAWQGNQTLPPVDVEAMATGPTSIRLSWTPVNYFPGFFNAAGGYTVYASTSPLGPFRPKKTVAGKASRSVELQGLEPATTYYFRIDTFSLPHEENPNTVHSQRTLIVSATTAARN